MLSHQQDVAQLDTTLIRNIDNYVSTSACLLLEPRDNKSHAQDKNVLTALGTKHEQTENRLVLFDRCA